MIDWTGQGLTVSCMSEEHLVRARALLEHAAGRWLVHRGDTLQDPWKALELAGDLPPDPNPLLGDLEEPACLAHKELLRGVFDAAMSVYLDRFLNVPPVRLPEPNGASRSRSAADRGGEMLNELTCSTRQQQVNEAGRLVADYLYGGGDPDRLIAALGRALLREDRNFHTIQMIEAAVRQFAGLRGSPDGVPVLVAAARYLAAHAPTMRAQGQTYRIAQRLHRGEKLFEDE